MESGQKLTLMERHTQQPIDLSRNKRQKMPGRKKWNLKVLKRILPRNRKKLWNRIRPRRWHAVLQEAYKCDVETCGNQHIEFKTAHHLFEVVHDVGGGRTRAVCWRKRLKPWEMKPRLAH